MRIYCLQQLCDTQRLVISDYLHDVDSLIYVDLDIIFLKPVETLWFKMEQFNTTQLVGAVPEANKSNGWYSR